MANRDQRHRQQDAWHDDNRSDNRSQMGQYADPQRQFGSERDQDSRHDARHWGARHEGSDLHRHDPAQASYGRAGAPDVHGGPSGGYQRDWRADPGYNQPGYMRNPSHQGYGSRDERGAGEYGGYRGDGGYGSHGQRDDGYRNQSYRDGGYDPGRDWNRGYRGDDERQGHAPSHERFQGGAGGYRSNTGPYAGSQTYGGYGDQLGYGSYQGGREQHHDPDYQQWREQQLRSLDDDYHSWRGERYKKFSEEFDSWRKNRQGAEQKNDLPGSAGNAGNTGKASGTK
ncbi:hypothetical protein [Pseudorhodoferax sp. Leaf274]|uniref:hypothetical protein n=1 Tax=Pseudorhodoferax sp. Leaf274 TaxID=1736318 RepID=UPI000703A6C6|nr:hypothetical protein [Pseudorhodoferax sp. Leaf274]KQP44186.1 hypothetical protein ASF44_28055 [Pseudorhodoferax sp. Leaf274]